MEVRVFNEIDERDLEKKIKSALGNDQDVASLNFSMARNGSYRAVLISDYKRDTQIEYFKSNEYRALTEMREAINSFCKEHDIISAQMLNLTDKNGLLTMVVYKGEIKSDW